MNLHSADAKGRSTDFVYRYNCGVTFVEDAAFAYSSMEANSSAISDELKKRKKASKDTEYSEQNVASMANASTYIEQHSTEMELIVPKSSSVEFASGAKVSLSLTPLWQKLNFKNAAEGLRTHYYGKRVLTVQWKAPNGSDNSTESIVHATDKLISFRWSSDNQALNLDCKKI